MNEEAAGFTFDPGLAGAQARPVDGIDNGYLAGYRVRFDEGDAHNQMRTSALLRYAQDIAWRHSEDLGFDRGWYEQRGLAWVVRGVALELFAPVPMGHTLRVSTAVVGHRKIWARRLVQCRLADGTLAARVSTDWVLLDGRNRIVRIPEDFGVAFVNPVLGGEILRVAPASGDPVATVHHAVRSTELDPLAHVNNAVYVDWLLEALDVAGWSGDPAETTTRTFRLEYLASAERGDDVVIDVFDKPEAWSARIRRADGVELVRAEGDTTRT